jgi:hypothetical protein
MRESLRLISKFNNLNSLQIVPTEETFSGKKSSKIDLNKISCWKTFFLDQRVKTSKILIRIENNLITKLIRMAHSLVRIVRLFKAGKTDKATRLIIITMRLVFVG